MRVRYACCSIGDVGSENDNVGFELPIRCGGFTTTDCYSVEPVGAAFGLKGGLEFAMTITRSVHAIEVSVVRDRISRSVS